MNRTTRNIVWVPKGIDYGTQICALIAPFIDNGGSLKKGCNKKLIAKINRVMPRGIRSKQGNKMKTKLDIYNYNGVEIRSGDNFNHVAYGDYSMFRLVVEYIQVRIYKGEQIVNIFVKRLNDNETVMMSVKSLYENYDKES